MDNHEIQQMFSEMGLGTPQQRDKLIKELSINMVDVHREESIKIITSSNTLKLDRHA